ncbi:hypothetical protein RJ641_023091 [Dillenia turbinata]|uniref:Uncharacterized protein n=1 Tax=Dillenia turbinata TaxID=194707 RepID=A0AAN8UDN4_9MAGN
MARPDANPFSLPNPPQRQQTEADPQLGQTANPVYTTQLVQFPHPGSCEYVFKQSEQSLPPIQQPNPTNFTYSKQVLQGYPVNVLPNPSYPIAPPPPTMQIPAKYQAANVQTFGPQMQYALTYANATANAYPQQVQPQPILVNNTAQVIIVQSPRPVYRCIETSFFFVPAALVTLCCSCVTFGQAAEIVDSGHTYFGLDCLVQLVE